MTEKEYRKWLETFIKEQNPDHKDALEAIGNWSGDDLWRWEKRAALIKELAKILQAQYVLKV